jgi:predicted NAD-dependent protein-ADP-ribosyltransferase YbiA (DUF1768 family)
MAPLAPLKAVGRTAAAREKANAVATAATAIQLKPLTLTTTGAAPATPAPVPATPTGVLEAPRTVAVAPGPASEAPKTYAIGEVFQFYADAATSKDILGIEDKGAGRWLAPAAPFPIKDGETIYPTMEHYIGGMRVKLATNKPELAETIFSREGTIHQRFLNDRLGMTNGGTKLLSEEEDHDILKTELSAVKSAMGGISLKKNRAIVDEAKWATAKDGVLEEALKQRWTLDKRFRKIVETARNQGKYLLYYTAGSTTNMGGVRSRTGQIDGENKVGKIIMKLAGYPQ